MAADDSYVPHIMDADMSEPWSSSDQHMFDSASLAQDTPLDFNQFLNNDAFVSSPSIGAAQLAYAPSPAKAFTTRHEQTPALSQPHPSLQPRSAASSSSPESSSQDSASESSSRRKRKATASSDSSPSALFDHMDTQDWARKDEGMDITGQRDSMFVKREPHDVLSLETDVDSINHTMSSHFDFGSSASSPALFNFGTPEQSQTVAPAKLEHRSSDGHAVASTTGAKTSGFFIGSRDESPMSAAMTTSQGASPAAMFDGQSPPFHSNDMFQSMPVWNTASMNSAFQNNPWQNELSPTQGMQYPGPEALPTPSKLGASPRHPRLYIHQDGSKSRVETQITIKLTLDPLPQGVSKLHLPTHTVSKPKLLAKQITKEPDTLELHTSLVCASAMEKPHLRQRALQRAASQESNTRKSGPRRSSTGDMAEDDDPDDPEKPANGGEVRICQNCVQRERKRAARKRVKKQEDEEAWAEYEYERVIVFNDKEYKDWQQPTPPKNEGAAAGFAFPPGAMQIDVPMRIACYCRHQSEKIGFRVIFTVKDFKGHLIAQEMTQPILITDDHKTQGAPPTGTGIPPLEPYNNPVLATTEQPEVQANFHRRPYHSTNDLQGLQNSWMNPKPASRPSNASGSQATSTTMTPRNVSRQTSPSAQNGPNKKRKSSSTHHHKLPRDLTMTRVSTSQPSTMAGEAPSLPATTLPPTSVPQGSSFVTTTDPGFMMQPIAVPASFNSGPSTPGSNGMIDPGNRSGSMENLAYQFYSVPNSAHHSRAPSPILASRQSISGFQHATAVPNVLANPMNMMQPQLEAQRQGPAPAIYKVTPGEYSKSGGIEVSCLGSNFTRNMEILFGDVVATTTTFWNAQLLVCLLPPAAHAGPVPVTVRPTSQSGFSGSSIPGPSATFTYIDDEDQRICELALRILCQKQSGNVKPDDYRGYARQIVNMATSQSWGQAMSGGSGMQHRSASAFDTIVKEDTEEMLLRCLDLIDMDDSPHAPRYNLRNKAGSTFLSLACSLGYGRIVAGLLARGANPDSRDRGGYTPLMMAAMHGHSQIVRRLILKGADPMMRSLQGYIAADFASSEEVLNSLQRVQEHRRTRSAGASSLRSRASSIASTHSIWESATPSHLSEYSSAEADPEDDDEDSDEVEEAPLPPAWNSSRRGSTKPSLAPPPAQEQVGMLSPNVAAAMNAWRENLTAQIQQFQQNVHLNLPNFQLPALPPLPDYQAHPMMRRISNLVPHRSPPRTPHAPATSPTGDVPAPGEYKWRDLFSTPALPPAYEEIYPDNADKDLDIKKRSLSHAAAEHVLDEQCAQRFDGNSNTNTVAAEPESPPASSSSAASEEEKASLSVEIGKTALSREMQEQVRRAHAQKLKRIRSDRNLFFVWIPLLLIVMVAMLHKRVPQLFAAASALGNALGDRGGRVVEVA